MLNEKQISDLSNSLNIIRDKVKKDQHFLNVFEDIHPEKLSYIIDYVIEDIIKYAIENEIDQWGLGKEILPILIGRLMGFNVEDSNEDEIQEYEDIKKFMN